MWKTLSGLLKISAPGSQKKASLHFGEMGIHNFILRSQFSSCLHHSQEYELHAHLAGRQGILYWSDQILAKFGRSQHSNESILHNSVRQTYWEVHASYIYKAVGELLWICLTPWIINFLDFIFLPHEYVVNRYLRPFYPWF